MKPQRYAAILARPGSDGDRNWIRRETHCSLLGFRAAAIGDGILLIDVEASILSCPGGCLIGNLFDGDGAIVRNDAVASLAPAELLDRYWGGYIAIRWDRGRPVTVFRDPSGAMPCYYATEPSRIFIASDLTLLMHLVGSRPVIDWSSVSALLLAIQYRSRETSIEGVCELLPGETLELNGSGVATSMLWSPWEHAAPECRITDMESACDAVRSAVRLSVSGWSSVISHPLLSVSGGLDSSIVAAALSSCGSKYDCFTLATEATVGDERPFARALASHLAVPLHEAMFDLSLIDLTRTAGAHLPRPGTRAFLQVTDSVSLRLMDAVGADGFFHGGGGDNVFCTIRSVSPILDRILTGSSVKDLCFTIHDVAKLTGADIWSIARAVAARLFRWQRAYRWPVDRRFLAPESIDGAGLSFNHPWLQPPAGALPGSAAHIANLLAIQNYLEGGRREQVAISVAPLMAQPVMEACLRVPSWLWISKGVDRAIARRAFAADLPEMIVNRRQKGTPGSVAAELYETRGAEIREWLLDGMMAEAGIIDRVQVERALARRHATGSMAYARIMTFCDFEAWCRSVGERRVEGNGSAFV